MNQQKNLIMKSLALTLVLFIIVIPALPSQQYKKVEASGGIIDNRFFNAVLAMVGGTSLALAVMGNQFQLSNLDFTNLKDTWETTLENDAVKKAAWLDMQTKYLAGGAAYAITAPELAKIGIYDLYTQLKDRLATLFYPTTTDTKGFTSGVVPSNYQYLNTVNGFEIYRTKEIPVNYSYIGKFIDPWIVDSNNAMHWQYSGTGGYPYAYNALTDNYLSFNQADNTLALMQVQIGSGYLYFMKYSPSYLSGASYSTPLNYIILCNYLGIKLLNPDGSIYATTGQISYPSASTDIIATDEDSISLLPVIPWIPDTVATGTITSPDITFPAGAVPIDVPKTVPIDPTDPIDPPVEDKTLLGTVATILAGILPISGLLDDIKVGIDGINSTVTAGIADITAPLTIVSDAVTSLEASENEYIDEWGEYKPIEEAKKKIDLKFPIIGALLAGISTLFSVETRPLIIQYPWGDSIKYITLDWYEPMRLQVREALALCFKLMTALSIYALVSSVFGMSVIGKSSLIMIQQSNDTNINLRRI